MNQDYFRKTFRIQPLEETTINLPLPAYETLERGALNLEHQKTSPFMWHIWAYSRIAFEVGMKMKIEHNTTLDFL